MRRFLAYFSRANRSAAQPRAAGRQSRSNAPGARESMYQHATRTAVSYAVPVFLLGSTISAVATLYSRAGVDKSLIPTPPVDPNDMTAISNAINDGMKKRADFIKMEKLNDKYRTFKYILNTHIKGRKAAENIMRTPSLIHFLTHELRLPEEKVLAIYAKYVGYTLKKKEDLEEQLRLQGEIRDLATEGTLEHKKVLDAKSKAAKAIADRVRVMKSELDAYLVTVLAADQLLRLKQFADAYELQIESASLVVARKNVFLLSFDGDVSASQVSRLREEISAVILQADPLTGDEVILNLRSGGGTVTGYGLAAAQLDRLRVAGLPLTVCIDEVAASGGYLMACVGNYLYASPFAVVGSVGVVTTMPNVSERLKREGVEVEDITAGKFKRTMTPFKTPSEDDRSKVQSDLENILVIFKSYVKKHRPSLDVDEIATGEVWFGPDALEKGLVDAIRTSDDVILDFIRRGADVYSVKYMRLPTGKFSYLLFDNFASYIEPFLTSPMADLLLGRRNDYRGLDTSSPENYKIKYAGDESSGSS